MGASLSVGSRPLDEKLINSLLYYPPVDVSEIKIFFEAKDNAADPNAKAMKIQVRDRDRIPCSPDDTALHLAARGWAQEAIQLLLTRGANVHAKNVDGDTPLHSVCGAELYIYKDLIHPDTGDAVTGIEPLPNVDSLMKSGVAVIKALVDAQTNINAQNELGDTPLHVAARSRWSSQFVPTLLNAGADFSIANKDGETALHLAARSLYGYEATKALVDFRADVKAVTKTGETPLHYASAPGYVIRKQQLIYLIDHGASVNAQNNDQNTILHLAQRNSKNHTDIVPLLIRYKADNLLPNNDGKSPEMIGEEAVLAAKKSKAAAEKQVAKSG